MYNNDPDSFFISGNTPSSKNSKIWSGTRKMLFHSKVSGKWLRKSKEEWLNQRLIFIEGLLGLTTPYYFELTFIRDSKREFDYINAAQIIFDTMKEYGWIEDDSASNIKPYFGDYRLDKTNPGVIIKILRQKPTHYGNTET